MYKLILRNNNHINLNIKNHIEKTFNIDTKLKRRTDDKNFLLEINKRDEIITL